MSVAIFGVVIEAVIIFAAAAVCALATNALRSQPLSLIALAPYETVVPCPEVNGEVGQLSAIEFLRLDKGTFLIDARSSEDFAKWHLTGATSIPFDYLDPTSSEKVRLVTSSRAKRVVIYGDGQDPDSGRELGRELAGKGIRNVFAVKGGAPALQAESPSEPKP